MKPFTVLTALLLASLNWPSYANEMLDLCEITVHIQDIPKTNTLSHPNECIETKLTLITSSGEAYSIKNRYIGHYQQTLPDFPYHIIEASSGGNNCCTDMYFINRNNGKIELIENSGPFLRIYANNTRSFSVMTPNRKVLHLENEN